MSEKFEKWKQTIILLTLIHSSGFRATSNNVLTITSLVRSNSPSSQSGSQFPVLAMLQFFGNFSYYLHHLTSGVHTYINSKNTCHLP